MDMENALLKQRIVELEQRLKRCKQENRKLKEACDNKNNQNRRQKIPL